MTEYWASYYSYLHDYQDPSVADYLGNGPERNDETHYTINYDYMGLQNYYTFNPEYFTQDDVERPPQPEVEPDSECGECLNAGSIWCSRDVNKLGTNIF